MWTVAPRGISAGYKKEIEDKLNDGRFTRTDAQSLNYVFNWEDAPEGFQYWNTAYANIDTVDGIKWEDKAQNVAEG